MQLIFFRPFRWQKGTKAPQAAGKIHTDFEKGFIMAEVMKYEDFKEGGSEAAVKVSSPFFFFSSHFLPFSISCIFFTGEAFLKLGVFNSHLQHRAKSTVYLGNRKDAPTCWTGVQQFQYPRQFMY